MKTIVTAVDVPKNSEISKNLDGAHYFDSYQASIKHKGRSSLQIHMDSVAKTPLWINLLMALRNNIVSILGLKNLGQLGAVDMEKPVDEYKVGDRVGIFTILAISDQEVILGDSDKHLDVNVSIYKDKQNTSEAVTISTVVHTHNVFGKIYMLFITPIHKIIVPFMLMRAG